MSNRYETYRGEAQADHSMNQRTLNVYRSFELRPQPPRKAERARLRRVSSRNGFPLHISVMYERVGRKVEELLGGKTNGYNLDDCIKEVDYLEEFGIKI